MRIAVLADIHGNLAALEAALEAVQRMSPDRLVIAGDVVDGAPDSAACWELVKSLGCPVLRGNHERYVFDFGTERAAPEWSTPRFGPVQVTVEDMTPEQRSELSRLPLSWRDPDAPGVLVVHASTRADSDTVLPYTPPERIAEMFGEPDLPPLILRGHNHECATRAWNGRQIVTVGSVGLPLDGNPAAQFTVVDQTREGWEVRHHAVPYDVEATLRRFREVDYLTRSGPMGRLMIREVATASYHFVPFLRFYHRARQEEMPLERAVECFLTGIWFKPAPARRR
jgi:predicted phosphodiesterase